MSEKLLQIQNLSVDFQTEEGIVHAIQDISFSISKGKTLALVGESGSGKSVLALSIMRLLPSPPSQTKDGNIFFSNGNDRMIDLLKYNEQEMQSIRGVKIGMIFQEPMTSLNPLMKCGKQVAETIMFHTNCSGKEAMEETINLFSEVKLPNPSSIADRYPHELSGGQKQRVMIAMAISCNPDLLIADEPTTALDVTIQKTILDLLKELQRKRDMSILFITHDLNVVKNFADDVMIMYKSKCIEYGETMTVFNNPKNAYTKGLLACRPSTSQRLKFLKTVDETMNNKVQHSAISITKEMFNERINTLLARKVILSLIDLNIWYPSSTSFFGKTTSWFKAVNEVNLQIHEGETLGLVGESGCGKTTIGKAIVQLVKPTKGEIIYKEKNIFSFSRAESEAYHKEVQIIFQDPYSSLNPRRTIGAAISEPMQVYNIHNRNERRDKVAELLQKVGLLPAHAARYPHEFSGGQRQRICIARALAMQPSLIICDESVSALDVSVQAQVLNLLVSLRDEFSLSYLFISHDLNVVKHISDRVAVMQKGHIEELNTSEEIYYRPTKAYTKTLIESGL